MGKKIARFFITVFGVVLGMSLVWLTYENSDVLGLTGMLEALQDWVKILIYVISGIIFGLIFCMIAPTLIKCFFNFLQWVERKTNELTMQEIFVGVVGLVIGLIIAALLSILVGLIRFRTLVIILDIVLFSVCGIVGCRLPVKRIKEINLPNWFRRGEKNPPKTSQAKPKILDTSAIIDGRFLDILEGGFVEGDVIVPSFVLDELRHIADSSDPLRRARGRRGLDALNSLHSDPSSHVTVDDRDYADLTEVDTKLLRLAAETGGVAVTNDYNLAKVAAVQGVSVFNINDLANALRINVVAGEIIDVTIVKEGKEANQGVAYFDDGTMVVVDGARKLVGETVTAIVTSVLQTSAGKMVFARVED